MLFMSQNTDFTTQYLVETHSLQIHIQCTRLLAPIALYSFIQLPLSYEEGSNFTSEETEAQTGSVAWPKSYNMYRAR